MRSRAKAKDSQAQAQSEGGAPKGECVSFLLFVSVLLLAAMPVFDAFMLYSLLLELWLLVVRAVVTGGLLVTSAFDLFLFLSTPAVFLFPSAFCLTKLITRSSLLFITPTTSY
jgi:hypothetical protein